MWHRVAALHALYLKYRKELEDRKKPDWVLQRYRILLRKPMHINNLSIDPRGTWSDTKAKKVLEIINPEAARFGIVFRMIDITTHNDRYTTVILRPFCIEHERAIADDEVCVDCKRATGD